MVTSYGVLVQTPCELRVCMKSWLGLKPTKEQLQVFNFFIKITCTFWKIRSFVCQVSEVHVLSSVLLFRLNGS